MTEGLVAFMLGLVITWVGTWLVTTSCPVDTAISIGTVSSGLKDLTGVKGGVWLESDYSNDIIYWFYVCSLAIKGRDCLKTQYHHHRREDEMLGMIEILYTLIHLK